MICLCGCNQEITRKGDLYYKYGHKKAYLANLPDKLCKCGCGEPVTKSKQYIHYHYLKINSWNRGVPCKEETKKRISETRINNRLSCGENNSMFGKHHTEETKQKQSKYASNRSKEHQEKLTASLKKTFINGHPTRGKKRTEEQRNKMRGENNPMWRGGRTSYGATIKNSREYTDWRTQVFKRDNYTCHKCNVRGNKIHAHHIVNFSKLIDKNKNLFDVNNGITLCKDCHKNFHKLYGKRNNNLYQFKEFCNGSICKMAGKTNT